jgi:F-type H+-transporting ATPase subunit delta
MVTNPIATRYAQALFETAKAEGVVEETLEHLTRIGQLVRGSLELRQLMLNPEVDCNDKVGLLDRILQGTWSALVRAFVQMVVSLERAPELAAVVDAFKAMVDEHQGRLRVLVRCAHPLPEVAVQRLHTQLAHREQKQIDIRLEVAPELLGGLQVFLGHRVIDGSVRRQLSDLKQLLQNVRVH